MRFSATPGWGPPVVVVCGSPALLAGACRLRWGVSLVGVSLVVCVCGVCGCARRPCCVVRCIFVVSALLLVWCGGVAPLCLPRALLCVVACVWCAGRPWFVVPASFGWSLRLVFLWVWLVCGVGPPPLLAELPGCCAPPLLAGVRLGVVVVGPLPLLAEGFGAGPRISWLGFAAGCGGWSLTTPG